MAYVIRNADGKIIAASTVENQAPGWELVEDGDEQYAKFLEDELIRQDPFRESDIHLARVLEDLIALLMDRGVIQFTELPAAAQKRLIERQSMRLRSKQLDLIDDESNSFNF